MISANLCVIATGRYKEFLPTLLMTADRYFLVDCDVRYHVFCDLAGYSPMIPSRRTVFWHLWEHKPWPYPTLHRYHAMLSAKDDLLDNDYTYYVDADCEFVGHVGEEVCGELVATLHHGYVGKTGRHLPLESRPECAAYTEPVSGTKYYCGGFQGGATPRWVKAMEFMRDRIDFDDRRKIIARHNDESFWNSYLSFFPPTLVLPETYCWHPFDPIRRPYAKPDPNKIPKIIALTKDREFDEDKRVVA